MSATIVIDARDAAAAQLRGWGRYAACLVDALARLGDPGLAVEAWTASGAGPEVLYEQVGLPLRLLRHRAALIHAPNCFLPLVRPCPGVVTVHDLAVEAWPEDFAPRTRWKFQRLGRAAARSAEAVIVPTRFTRDDLVERWGVDPGRVHVIAEAPALAVRPGGDPPPGRYLLAVGDLRRKKNLGVLVTAFAALHRAGELPGRRLVLAGLDSGEGGRLRALAGDAPVVLTGYVDDAMLDAMIRGAELLVHPSLYEGFGLVVLEAMARGVPVIAARATSLPEAGGDAAAYFDPGAGAQEHLAAVIRELVRDPARRAAMRARGLERAASFSWEAAARATLEVYRSVL